MCYKPAAHQAHCTVARIQLESFSSLTRAGESVSIKALLACTPVGSWSVDTVCIGVAIVVLCRALILIYRKEKKREKELDSRPKKLIFLGTGDYFLPLFGLKTFTAR